MRASVYNSMPLSGVEALASFMQVRPKRLTLPRNAPPCAIAGRALCSRCQGIGSSGDLAARAHAETTLCAPRRTLQGGIARHRLGQVLASDASWVLVGVEKWFAMEGCRTVNVGLCGPLQLQHDIQGGGLQELGSVLGRLRAVLTCVMDALLCAHLILCSSNCCNGAATPAPVRSADGKACPCWEILGRQI